MVTKNREVIGNPLALLARAIIYTGRGGPEVIKIIERTVRPPEAGEVRIRVRAAAVNPTDELLRTVELNGVQFPVTPGADAAGVIESVGPGELRLRAGDRVMAAVTAFRPEGGAQSALIVVPSASVAPVPQGTTFSQAAGLPMNGLTALRALELAGLKAGQVLAVSGGAGLLAHYTIAAAKRQGLTVIADAKPQENDLVRSYGADFVVERGDGFTDAIRKQFPQGADALIDTAALGLKSLPAIRDGGVYIHVRRITDVPPGRGIQSKLVWVLEVLERTDWLDTLRKMVEQGSIKLSVAGEYQPEDAADAQRALRAGGVRGRPVILF